MDLLEAIQEARRRGIKVENPLSHDDLGRAFRALKKANIHHNLKKESIYAKWHECELCQALGKHKNTCRWCNPYY